MQTDQTVHKRTVVPSSSIQTVTVGTGVAPVHALPLADFTADREFHPALKTNINLIRILSPPN